MAAGVLLLVVAPLRCELGGREGDPAEHLAGVLRTTGIIATFLGGDAVIHHRNDQLGIPLQTNDGELAQGHKESSAIRAGAQLLIKHPPDAVGNLKLCRILAAAIAGIPHPGAEHHGIQHLFYGHQIGREPGAAGDRTNF